MIGYCGIKGPASEKDLRDHVLVYWSSEEAFSKRGGHIFWCCEPLPRASLIDSFNRFYNR